GREHLAACPECRERLADLRSGNRALSAALALLDPVVVAGPATPARSAPTFWSRSRRELPRAAALLLTFAAAASATLPGSPVREWISGAFDRPQRELALDTPPPVPARESAARITADSPEAGVSVPIDNGRLRVIVTGAAAGVRVRASLVEGRLGGVSASGDAAGARFETGVGVVRVTEVSGGELRVEIPRAATAASIVIDGRTYLEKEGDAIRVDTALEEAPGSEVLFLVKP
ncbi:MAG TPA: hypothetical protein VMN39_07580, partial [Longimicrobiaceae bacterium]|nr:hypothetical protein [Longimicrobiaceae bacterium]